MMRKDIAKEKKMTCLYPASQLSHKATFQKKIENEATLLKDACNVKEVKISPELVSEEPAFRRRAVGHQIQLQDSTKIIFHGLDAACAFVSRAIYLAVRIDFGTARRRLRMVGDRRRGR